MFWMIPLAMGAAGALADKKNPLRGAAIGAGLGMTGGAAAGGLLGAGAAGAGAAGTAGAAGAAGGASGGLLGAAGTGAAGAGAGAGTAAATQTAGLLGVPGAASGAGSQAAMLAAQNQGFGAIGQQLTAQAAGGASGMSVPTSVNLAAGMQRAGEALTKAKPMIDAAGTGMQVANAMQEPPQQAPMPQIVPTAGGAESLTSLYQQLQQGSQGQLDKDAEMRRARRRGLIGGM